MHFTEFFLNVRSSFTEVLIVEKLIHPALDFFSPYDPALLLIESQIDPPHVIKELIGKVYPAQERDAIARSFHSGVPTAMAYKTSDGGMSKDLLLRSPNH